MNPLALLPLLAAAAMAAPGGIALAGPTLTYATPAIAQYQVNVPVTKTVHYDVKPVVTGYSSTILKPSIVQQAVAAPVVSVAAPQQVVVRSEPAVVSGFTQLNNQLIYQTRQFEPPAGFPSLPAPGGNSSDNPFPAPPAFPAPPGGNSSDNPTPTLPPAPAFPPSQLLQLTNPFSQIVAPVQQVVRQDAVVVEARNVAPAVYGYPYHYQVAAPAVQQVAVAQPVVQLRQAQAGDFGPLVTQEKVLAPVRQHTQITPQLTQVQPEVTVRKVIQEVPVAQPIYQTPVVHQTVVAQPAVQQVVAQPQFLSAGLVGQNFVGLGAVNGLNGFRVVA